MVRSPVDDVRGVFPFGQPNLRRPMRLPSVGHARALVVGVYPSAFHVSWTPPPAFDTREPSHRRRPYIQSLAVDVEPIVFWDGETPSPDEELERWKDAVGFDEERHGRVTGGTNGPSGAGLVREFLAPLSLGASTVAFTDAVPWFFIKAGRESQGEAISERFAPIAERLPVHRGSLPVRPPPRGLVAIARSEPRRSTLRAEVLEAGAPLLITFGQESLDSVTAIADEVDGVQARLSPERYGEAGRLRIDGHTCEFLPLVHPEFHRRVLDARTAKSAKYSVWRSTLAEWRERLRSQSP